MLTYSVILFGVGLFIAWLGEWFPKRPRFRRIVLHTGSLIVAAGQLLMIYAIFGANK
jgi:hypothetical protein